MIASKHRGLARETCRTRLRLSVSPRCTSTLLLTRIAHIVFTLQSPASHKPSASRSISNHQPCLAYPSEEAQCNALRGRSFGTPSNLYLCHDSRSTSKDQNKVRPSHQPSSEAIPSQSSPRISIWTVVGRTSPSKSGTVAIRLRIRGKTQAVTLRWDPLNSIGMASFSKTMLPCFCCRMASPRQPTSVLLVSQNAAIVQNARKCPTSHVRVHVHVHACDEKATPKIHPCSPTAQQDPPFPPRKNAAG